LEDQSAEARRYGALKGAATPQTLKIKGIGSPDCARGSLSDT
jgi:hypothetical protein